MFKHYTVSPKFAANVRDYVRAEADGVHIVLPGREEPVGIVGFVCKPQLPGDFKATLAYEILRSEGPTKGYGMGMTFWVIAETPVSDTATIGRRTVPKGPFLGTDRVHYQDKKTIHVSERFAAGARRGKLRLARQGEHVIYSAADEEGAFQELRRAPFPVAPIRAVRVSADTGTGLGEFEVRIIDLHIRSAASDAAAAAVTFPEAPADRRSPSGLRVGLVILALAVGAGLVLLWWARRSRRSN